MDKLFNVALCSRYYGCGKTTIAKYLRDRRDYKILNFAFGVKVNAAIALKNFYCLHQSVDQIYQDLVDGVFSKNSHTNYHGVIIKPVRKMFQDIGDGMRNYYHEDIWLDGFEKQFNQYCIFEHNVVVDDLRYPNEFIKLKELNFKIIFIDKEKDENMSEHPSERIGEYIDSGVLTPDLTINYHDGEVYNCLKVSDWVSLELNNEEEPQMPFNLDF